MQARHQVTMRLLGLHHVVAEVRAGLGLGLREVRVSHNPL